MRNIAYLKQQLAERLIFKMRNDLQSILAALPLLTHEQLSAEEKQKINSIVTHKINESMNVLLHVQTQISLQPEHIVYYPIDAKAALQQALKNIQSLAQQHQVTLDCQLPTIASLVLAAPEALSEIIFKIINLLLQDIKHPKTIHIQLIEQPQWLIYRFRNQSCDLSNELLQHYLSHETPSTPEGYRQLQSAIETISRWGGQLTALSESGLSFELRLKSFI